MQSQGPIEAFELIGFKPRLRVILIFLVAFVALSIAVWQIFSAIRANHIKAAVSFVENNFAEEIKKRNKVIQSGSKEPPITYKIVGVTSDFFGSNTSVKVYTPIGGEMHELRYVFRGTENVGVIDDLVP